MGQKINPVGMRLQINRTWDSRWYADGKEYGQLLHEDIKIRDFIKKECKQAGVSRVIIERPHKKCRVSIHTARPGGSSSARRVRTSKSCAASLPR